MYKEGEYRHSRETTCTKEFVDSHPYRRRRRGVNTTGRNYSGGARGSGNRGGNNNNRRRWEGEGEEGVEGAGEEGVEGAGDDVAELGQGGDDGCDLEGGGVLQGYERGSGRRAPVVVGR